MCYNRLGSRRPYTHFVEPIALVQSFYLLAEALPKLAAATPTLPPHLSKVTETR